jgi:hypothetical protein
MREAMAPTDLIVLTPPSGQGATFTVRYDIPRPDAPAVAESEAKDIVPHPTIEANFQRIGSISNTHVGSEFEKAAVVAFAGQGITVEPNFAVTVGVGRVRKLHRFDLGSANPPILIECKCHRWTATGNAPSAKLTVWNEAMYYFAIVPLGFRKILFVLRDYSETRGVTLAEHYLSRYVHMVPEGVEIWEYDGDTRLCKFLDVAVYRAQAVAKQMDDSNGQRQIESDGFS